MVKRFVAKLPRKQILCAGSELSIASFEKCYQSCAVLSPTLFPLLRPHDRARGTSVIAVESAGKAMISRWRPISFVEESLVGETHDRTIHQMSGRFNRTSARAYQ
jgi:hypothetical protein